MPNATPEEELQRGWLATRTSTIRPGRAAPGGRGADRHRDGSPCREARALRSDERDEMDACRSRLVGRGGADGDRQGCRRRGCPGTDPGHGSGHDRLGRTRAPPARFGRSRALRTGRTNYEALIAGHVARIEGRDDPAQWQAAADRFTPRSIECLTARYRQAEAMLATRAPRDEVRAVMAVGTCDRGRERCPAPGGSLRRAGPACPNQPD